MKNLSFFALIVLFLSSCGNKAEHTNSTEPGNHDMDIQVVEDTTSYEDSTYDDSEREYDVEVHVLKAKFVEFDLGDAEHYIFEDEDGQFWDFGGYENNNVDFYVGLSEEEANESNQGWASNEDLVGKWFTINYFDREQQLYIDGPTGWVSIIQSAELLEE